jgi:type VI secretion system VasD/TssJ family lipoprotein
VKTPHRFIAILIPFFLSLASCATTTGWTSGEKAVSLRFEADKMLNARGGEPHPVGVCVYQLRDRDEFMRLAGSEDGLYRLLECTPFDSSVADVKRIVVTPGKDREVSLDRAAGARFVALVAGYFTVDRYRSVRIFSIPRLTTGFIFPVEEPAPFDVAIRLGPRGILPGGTR